LKIRINGRTIHPFQNLKGPFPSANERNVFLNYMDVTATTITEKNVRAALVLEHLWKSGITLILRLGLFTLTRLFAHNVAQF
jgi:hypothetical protein